MSSDVRRPKEYEEMLAELCQSDQRVFSTYKDALVFCACLGFENNLKKSFKQTSEPVGMHIFKAPFDEGIFDCIALITTQDPRSLSDDELHTRISLFEEYAAGGLELLKNRVYDAPGDREDALLAFINEQFSSGNSILGDITSLGNL